MTGRPVQATWAKLVVVAVFVLAWAAFPRPLRGETKKIPAASSYLVYVGTYTAGTSKGIYDYRFDPRSGRLTPIGVAAEVVNPSFVTTDPQHRFLYAVTEMGQEHGPDAAKKNGSISSFSINRKTGALTFLNKIDSGGGGPCHLVVDKTGKMLFVANYGSGSVASFAIKPDGSIGEQDRLRPAHRFERRPCASEGPACARGRALARQSLPFCARPGNGPDQIYRVDAAKGTFTPNDPPFATVKAGYGPRHFTFVRGAKFAYAVWRWVPASSYFPTIQ